MTSRFVKLTDPEGNPVWIVGQWVTQVQYPAKGQHHPSAQAVIVMGGNKQAVRQTPEYVVLMLEGDEP